MSRGAARSAVQGCPEDEPRRSLFGTSVHHLWSGVHRRRRRGLIKQSGPASARSSRRRNSAAFAPLALLRSLHRTPETTTTMNISANWTTTPAGHGHDPIGGGFNASNLAPWLVSRMRIFFYLSDPREETFQHVDQVPDYHAEVSRKKTDHRIVGVRGRETGNDFNWSMLRRRRCRCSSLSSSWNGSSCG